MRSRPRRRGAAALVKTAARAAAIEPVGVHTRGISLAVDQARSDAMIAIEDLIDVLADTKPTVVGRSVGIG